MLLLVDDDRCCLLLSLPLFPFVVVIDQSINQSINQSIHHGFVISTFLFLDTDRAHVNLALDASGANAI